MGKINCFNMIIAPVLLVMAACGEPGNQFFDSIPGTYVYRNDTLVIGRADPENYYRLRQKSVSHGAPHHKPVHSDSLLIANWDPQTQQLTIFPSRRTGRFKKGSLLIAGRVYHKL